MDEVNLFGFGDIKPFWEDLEFLHKITSIEVLNGQSSIHQHFPLEGHGGLTLGSPCTGPTKAMFPPSGTVQFRSVQHTWERYTRDRRDFSLVTAPLARGRGSLTVSAMLV